jgi:hypothetical protein
MPSRLLALALALTGCPSPGPGEPCEVAGDGFTRRDPCESTCVEWEVTCPDASKVTPGVCTDGGCSTNADCAEGWFCASINATDSECLPASVCTDGG